MNTAIAIDPGRTTGFCAAEIENGEAIIQPWQERLEVHELFALLEEKQPDMIIVEKFQFRKNSQEGLDLFPKELIGVARLWTQQNPTARRLFEQSASQGMGYYNDKLLKLRDVYVPGIPHAMDATRHLLHWFTFGAGYQFNTSGKEYPFRLVTEADLV